MIQIKLPENLIEISLSETRVTINSDETFAFTEHRPVTETGSNIPTLIDAHQLFTLFTAEIIRKKTLFTR